MMFTDKFSRANSELETYRHFPEQWDFGAKVFTPDTIATAKEIVSYVEKLAKHRKNFSNKLEMSPCVDGTIEISIDFGFEKLTFLILGESVRIVKI